MRVSVAVCELLYILNSSSTHRHDHQHLQRLHHCRDEIIHIMMIFIKLWRSNLMNRTCIKRNIPLMILFLCATLFTLCSTNFSSMYISRRSGGFKESGCYNLLLKNSAKSLSKQFSRLKRSLFFFSHTFIYGPYF